MNKIFKIIFIVIGSIVFLFLLFLFLPNLFSIFTRDISPINDSDLRLEKVIIPESENAYYDLVKLKGNIYEPKGDKNLNVDNIVAGKIWDEKFVEEILSNNVQSFAYFATAANKPKFQDPVFSDPSGFTPYAVITNLSDYRKMSKLSTIRALYLARQGKAKEALDEALNFVKIGQKIQESQSVLIEYLVGVAIKDMGLQTAQKVITSSNLSSKDLKEYVKKLDEFYKKDGLIIAWKGEYLTQVWVTDEVARGGDTNFGGEDLPFFIKKSTNNFYFRPNKTKALFADYARAEIKNVSELCGDIKSPEAILIFSSIEPLNMVRLYFTENAVGKIISNITAISLSSINERKCDGDFFVAATQLLASLKAYKNDTGNLPTTLNELVPNYIPSIPIDSFDGKPIRYSSTKKIIYSVGKDLIDSGGGYRENWLEMTDPTFKIEF